jgi:hypothetical protein
MEINGPIQLMDALEKFEISSRISGNHLSLIGIMKLIDLLTLDESSKHLVYQVRFKAII